jgi:hypothetical protein
MPPFCFIKRGFCPLVWVHAPAWTYALAFYKLINIVVKTASTMASSLMIIFLVNRLTKNSFTFSMILITSQVLKREYHPKISGKTCGQTYYFFLTLVKSDQ